MERKKYTEPLLKVFHIDAEISLILESSPPEGPNEGIGSVLINTNQDINKSFA